MIDHEAKKLAKLSTFLRVYGILSLVIFGTLFLGFMIRTPLLADGGSLNWLIWNGTDCGGEPCHVPPMLFIIYLVWAAFLLRAAKKPRAYASFLDFTMWANLFHGLLMCAQTATMMHRYWSKWLTDIPFLIILALGIYRWRPSSIENDPDLNQRSTA